MTSSNSALVSRKGSTVTVASASGIVTKIGKDGRPRFVSPKKASAPSAPVVAPVVEKTNPAVETSAITPTVTTETKKVLFGRTLGKKDVYGFGETTEASYIASGIASGKYTRPELLASFLAKFSPNANETGDIKAKKTSFSVFLSDVRRPFGTYTGSRSLIVLIAESGKLSFEAKRADAVREAVGAGILDRIRGVKGTKREAILREYGFPIV